MKKMDVTWFYIAVGLVALGSLIGVVGSVIAAFNTKKFRDDSIGKQEKIVELNEAIDSVVKRVEGINKDISSAQQDIKEAQKQIQSISSKTNEIAEDLTGAIIGRGSSVFIFDHYSRHGDDLELAYLMKGVFPLKDIKISISDNIYKADFHKNESWPLQSSLPKKMNVIQPNSRSLIFEVELLRPQELYTFSRIKKATLRNIYDYSIKIDMADSEITQRIVCHNMEKRYPYYNQVIKRDRSGKSSEVVFFQNEGFELDDRNHPIIDKEFYKRVE